MPEVNRRSFDQEILSATLAPWSHSHPRNDSQLIFPLSDDRLLFVWCQYYVGSPSRIFDTPYDSLRADDHAPCRIVARVSRDRGRTWSQTLTIQDNTAASNVKHPNLLRLSDNRVLLTYSSRDVAAGSLRIFARISEDECDTWGEPRQISPEGGWWLTNADHILRHSSGRLVLPCYHTPKRFMPGEVKAAFTAGCFYSDDEAATWLVGDQVGLSPRGVEEPAVIERRDGSLLALLRTFTGYLSATVSRDRGQTWSPPRRTELTSPATCTALKRLPDGALLLVWNNAVPYFQQHPGSGIHLQPRNPLTAAISRNDGETWTNFRNVEDRTGYDNAYPSVTVVGDEVFVAWYGKIKAGVGTAGAEVRMKAFHLDWFTSPVPHAGDALQSKAHHPGDA